MATKEMMTDAQVVERGLVCKVFYARGGESMRKTWTEARNGGVTADWFSDPFCRVVWRAAERVYAEMPPEQVKLINIVSKCRSVAASSRDIEESSVVVKVDDFEDAKRFVSAEDTVASFVRDVRNASIVRKAKEKLTGAVAELGSGEDPTAVLTSLIRDAQNLMKDNSGCHRMSISDLCDKALADWDEAYHQRIELGNYEWCPGIPLPWRKMAYALNGFTPDMTILAARPGVGKTSMALNFARYWLDIGKKVTFVSVDMSPIGFVKRQLAERTSISSRKLQFGKSLHYEDDRKKVMAEIEVLKGLEKSGNFNLLSEYDVDIIKSTCSILKDRDEIDVLIVDYIQLLKFKGCDKLPANAKTTYVSNTLHELANELQIPVLCLSQLNRDNTKDGGREPQLSDLRDSGAIEQDAANVLLLYRHDALYNKWKDAEPPVQFAKGRVASNGLKAYCPIWCLIAKSREGDAGTKLPFVVVQNKYSWYLGDYEANGDDKFARVYDDWRHDSIERIWQENDALIRMEDIRTAERINLNNERRQAGLPEIVWN